jgi:urease subunit gamma/beta
MTGIRELVDDVRIEVLLEDGARLVVLLDPLGGGRPAEADGSGAIVPASDGHESAGGIGRDAMAPGAAPGVAPAHLERQSLDVRSTSKRVVRVSSHFPFERANPRLEFYRAAAAGFRLDLPAGSSERWSPGESKRVTLVRYARDGHDGEQA